MYRDKGIFRHRCKVYRKHRCRRCGVQASLLRSRQVSSRILSLRKPLCPFETHTDGKARIKSWLFKQLKKRHEPIVLKLTDYEMVDDSVWFGSGFIYARLNLNQYIGLGKRKAKHRKNPPDQRKILSYYFLFLSYGLNTKFEHKSVNTGGYHWRLQ